MKNTKLKKTLEIAKLQLQHYEKLLSENPNSFFHKVLVSNTKLEIEHLEQELAKELLVA